MSLARRSILIYLIVSSTGEPFVIRSEELGAGLDEAAEVRLCGEGTASLTDDEADDDEAEDDPAEDGDAGSSTAPSRPAPRDRTAIQQQQREADAERARRRAEARQTTLQEAFWHRAGCGAAIARAASHSRPAAARLVEERPERRCARICENSHVFASIREVFARYSHVFATFHTGSHM